MSRGVILRHYGENTQRAGRLKIDVFVALECSGQSDTFSFVSTSTNCATASLLRFFTVLNYVDKYDISKQPNKKREESASRLTAKCDLLTTYCDFSNSKNIKM
jgi:hypothetical protein